MDVRTRLPGTSDCEQFNGKTPCSSLSTPRCLPNSYHLGLSKVESGTEVGSVDHRNLFGQRVDNSPKSLQVEGSNNVPHLNILGFDPEPVTLCNVGRPRKQDSFFRRRDKGRRRYPTTPHPVISPGQCLESDRYSPYTYLYRWTGGLRRVREDGVSHEDDSTPQGTRPLSGNSSCYLFIFRRS